MAELEGFICPLCMQSLAGVGQLEEHMREEHGDSVTKKVKANFKNFLGKAKTFGKKIHVGGAGVDVSEGAAAVATARRDELEEEEEEEDWRSASLSGINPELWPEQEFGFHYSHMDRFRAVRDRKVQRIAVETNRLLVRLNKLLTLLNQQRSAKTKQLKALEQDIVPWKRDEDQKRCMKCSQPFSAVRRRRHHCRLCGDVICKECSGFLPISEAYLLLSQDPSHKVSPAQSRRGKREEEEEKSDELRVCPVCEELFVRQLAKVVLEGKTMIVGLYEHLTLMMQEADKLKPSYMEMAESLLEGQYHFKLLDAQKKRQQLVGMYEKIDSASKQIMALKYNDGREPSSRHLRVQRGVRMFASTYLQDNLLTLPALPTREKLNKIRHDRERLAEERRREIERQQEEQRRLEMQRLQRLQEEEEAAASAARRTNPTEKLHVNVPTDNPLSMRSIEGHLSKLSSEFSLEKMKRTFKREELAPRKQSTGWVVESGGRQRLDSDDDPFEVQRQQLMEYLQQARLAGRKDEVAAMEASLRDIEAEIQRRDTHPTYY